MYSHMWSEYNKRPFVAEKKESIIIFCSMLSRGDKYGCRNSGKSLRNGIKNSGEISQDENTPSHIVDWPKTSWLKYRIKYCIDRKKYFVYPYISYSTNFVEIGQHCKTSNTVYQDAYGVLFDKAVSFCKVWRIECGILRCIF